MKAYRKAIAGFVSAFGAAFGAALLDGHLERPEFVAALGIGIATGVSVWATPRNESR